MLRNKLKSHSLANKLTPIRIRLERFLLDHSEGWLENRSDTEKLKEAQWQIERTIVQIDNIFNCNK
jgi:hypothetical protein